MATTRNDISDWMMEGVKNGKPYMAIWCDTYDFSDYPHYYDSAEECQEHINTTGRNMQKVMEVYDLDNDPEGQLNSHRAWALRPQP